MKRKLILIIICIIVLFGFCKINKPVNQEVLKEINKTKNTSLGDAKRQCTVAMIDTGINYNVIDENNLWSNEEEIANDGIDNDHNGYIDDCHGWNFVSNTNVIYDEIVDYQTHGTFITSILSNTHSSYTDLLEDTDIKIMCLKVLNSATFEGKVDHIIEAIQYAEDNGAKICNLSMASYKEYANLKNVIEKSSMLFIVPSANDGKELNDNFKVFPACWNLSNVISVASIDSKGKLWDESNYGKEYVDVCAPGEDIAGYFDDDQVQYISGTSCSVPFVTGLAALVYSYSKIDLNANNIKKYICDNTVKNDDLRSYVKYGIINYKNTLNVLLDN